MEMATKVVLMPFLDNLNNEGQATETPFVDDIAFGLIEPVVDRTVGFKQEQKIKLYKMLGTRADVINGNNRVYPRPVLTAAVRNWKSKYGATGQLTGDPARWGGEIGEEGHPPSYVRPDGKLGWRSKTENKCIKVVDVLEPDEAGNVHFIFHTIDTKRGQDLQAVLDAGGKIGCSMRASGKGKVGTFCGRKVNVATSLDLTVFDVLDDPALTDTLGSAVPITDSQIEEVLADGIKVGAKEFSDAIDPYIKAVKETEKLSDLVKLKTAVGEIELDEIDRAAFESAYYRRYYQIRELMEAQEEEAELQRKPIGFSDNQKPNEKGDDLMYTFEQLMKMTDAELQRVRQETPECTAMCDSILTQRNQDAELQSLRQAEADRQARIEAQSFMDSADVQDKLKKLPPNAQQVIRSKVDLTNKESAERTFTDAYDLAIQFSAGNRLQTQYGYDLNKPIVDHRAPTGDVFVGENQGWMEVVDKIQEAAEDLRKRYGKADPNTQQINRPILDGLLNSFDKDNAGQLHLFADNFAEVTSTETVMNGVSFYKAVLTQAFQTMVALPYVETGTFSGEFATIPIESYQRVNTTSTRGREGRSKAKSILKLGGISVPAESRELIAKITNQSINYLKSGPIRYDILGRLAFHLGEDIKREASLDIHNEMLLAADEYNCVKVTGETPDVSADRKVITLLRGGKTGEPNKYTPIVRPRYSKDIVNGVKVPRVYNQVTITVAGEVVDLEYGAIIDYENGEIVFSDALPAGAIKAEYAYVTNIAIFPITPSDGVTKGEHWKDFIHVFGGVVSKMAESPTFYKPDFSFMSQTAANNIGQADTFDAWKRRPGTDLAPTGWVANIHNVEAVSHNEPWNGGDTRVLLGTKLGCKYYVESNLQIEPPQPGRGEDGDQDGSKEIYVYSADALVTPLLQQFRTIKMV